MRIEDAVIERHIEVTLGDREGSATIPARGRRMLAVATAGLACIVVAAIAVMREEPAPVLARYHQEPLLLEPVADSAAALAALPADLKSLQVRRLPQEAFGQLRRFTSLRRLIVSGAMDDNDGGHSHVPWPLPHTCLPAVLQLRVLESLEFLAVDGVGAEDLEVLADLPLHELRLRRADEIGDAHVAVVVRMRNLRRLCLEADGGELTARGAAALAGASQLEELRVRGIFALEREDYLTLTSLPQLRILDVSAPWYLRRSPGASEAPWPTAAVDQVDDEFLARAAKLPQLRVLGLGARRRVTDTGLARLRSTALEEIDLHQCAQVTLAGLRHLPPSLRVLDVHECTGLLGLPDHLRELRRLDARFDQGLNDDVLAALRGCAHLQELDLSNCPGLGKPVIAVLAHCRELRRLGLRGHPWIDDEVAGACAGLGHLEQLDLGSTVDRYRMPGSEEFSGGVTRLTARGVETLAALPKLRVLHLAAAPPLPVAAIRRLRGLPLRSLNLSWTEIVFDDQTPGLTPLRELFPGTQVTWWPPATNTGK